MISMEIALYPKYLIRSLFVHGKRSFFKEGYKLLYPEYSRHGMTPWQHYVIDGKRKGFDNGNHPSESVFFREGYETEYPDVKAAEYDPWRHYAETGKKEGRDNGLHPNVELFFAEGYLEMYPDVKESGLDPWHHYAIKGRQEGRDNGLHPNDEQFFAAGYLAMYPHVDRDGLDPWHHYVLKGKNAGYDNGLHPCEGMFFSDGYLEMYHDVAECGFNPWRHYVLHGKKEGRDNGNHPNESAFLSAGYLEMYPEVAESGEDPWHHYVLKGKNEGRDNGHHPDEAFFSSKVYLAMYPDVAKAKVDPWIHYIQYGKAEGRNRWHSKLMFWPEAAPFYSRNVLIIAELSLPQCKLYRVDQKAVALEKQGYKVYVCKWSNKAKCIRLMQFCSAVIFYRVPDLKAAAACFEEAKRLKIHTFYDIDDLIFNEDIYATALSRYNISETLKAHLIKDASIYRSAMLKADDHWFSTKALCDVSDSDYGLKSFCVPNSIPEELSEVASEFAGRKKDSSTLRIFYGAASPHDRDVELVQEALERILTKNENVELLLIGDIRFAYKNLELKKRIIRVDRLGLRDYYYLVSQCDIAVIPLESNLFNSAKSNIKYIEASMFSIPSVCSDLYEFSSVVRNGENGFIVKNKDEWTKYLQLLIDSREKREAIGRAARATVLERYSLTRLGKQLSSLIEPYAVRKSSRESMLLVNVLYGVSSYGGATVVAERLAEEIQANSNYEVNVFSTYTDLHDDLGTLRRYTWNGVNVWAVNVVGVSLSYTDKKLRAVFAKVLDYTSPKLVDFHCIQTLGMDMCLECIERKIPYFVMIHDGWWNCARQFLVDKRGHYCGDQVSSCSICKNRCDIRNSDFYQKRHLAQYVLGNAEKLYTPSYYFTRLIQRNFPDLKIYTNKNGIIQNKKDTEQPTEYAHVTESKIVLGFFGGRDVVKGYFFIKECFESLGSDAGNFKIIFIDTARRNGEKGLIKNDSWPLDTEVKGYTPHEKMYTLYRKIDVLLFPSMWKESFGLMVREAIYNDVFVVCSDCGGPSEAIANNENGLIFPMGDKDKFRECLEFLIKNKDFIKNYRTKNFGDVRTFKEQALELLKDFDKVQSRGQQVQSVQQKTDIAGESV